MAEINYQITNIKKDIIYGISIGIGFIFLNIINPNIAIGFPLLPQSSVEGRFLIIVLLAPIGEELIFRLLLPLILINQWKLGVLIVGIITATAFSLFHLAAYAGSFSAQAITAASGAFLAAALFGIIAYFVTIKQKNPISAMIAHGIFNAFLASKVLVIIGV